MTNAINDEGVSWATPGSIPKYRNNDVFGNKRGLAVNAYGIGNFAADPQFASLHYGDLHIQRDSPCIDRGNDAVVPPGDVDLDGKARIMGAGVDIGAYEFPQ